MQRKQITTIVSAVIVSVVILGFAAYSEFYGDRLSRSNDLTEEEKNAAALTEAVAKQDDDNDGLKNWEEILWKTDPQNSDTDGDGTEDNAEILAGRDPTLPGPDDQTSSPAALTINTEGEEVVTSVDYLAADLLVEYAALKEDGTDPNAEKDILDELIVGSAQGIEIKTYTQEDFVVSQNAATKESLEIYYANFLEIFTAIENTTGYEIQLILASVQNNAPQELEKIDRSTAIHDKMIEGLLAIETPRELISEHVSFTNNLHITNESIKNVRMINENPVLALASLQAYTEIEPVFLASSETLGASFGTLYSNHQ